MNLERIVRPTCELRNEQTEANSHRCDEITGMLLCCKHENGEHELRCEDHFDHDSLRDGRPSTERCAHSELALKQCLDDVRCDYASNNLSDKQQDPSHPCDSPDEHHSDRDLQQYALSIKRKD